MLFLKKGIDETYLDKIMNAENGFIILISRFK